MSLDTVGTIMAVAVSAEKMGCMSSAFSKTLLEPQWPLQIQLRDLGCYYGGYNTAGAAMAVAV